MSMMDQPMGQCAVTGQVVPEDELVVIHGQRVCAAGKAILLDRLKSGETMPGEYERPGVWLRFGCIFLDGLIIAAPFGVFALILTPLSNGNLVLIGALSVLATAVQVIYYAQMHAAKGQSVGKMAGKLKVVNLDGSPISLRTAYIRALIYPGCRVLIGLTMMFNTPLLAMLGEFLAGIIVLADTLFALFDRDQQRSLHDRIAGTRVIKLG